MILWGIMMYKLQSPTMILPINSNNINNNNSNKPKHFFLAFSLGQTLPNT